MWRSPMIIRHILSVDKWFLKQPIQLPRSHCILQYQGSPSTQDNVLLTFRSRRRLSTAFSSCAVFSVLARAKPATFAMSFLELLRFTSMYSTLRVSFADGSEGSALICLAHFMTGNTKWNERLALVVVLAEQSKCGNLISLSYILVRTKDTNQEVYRI